MDTTTMTEAETQVPTLEVSRLFKAPRRRVYAAWTEAEAMAQWMGPGDMSAKVELLEARVGGSFRLVMEGEQGPHPASGKFLEVVENERLVFTWTWEFGELEGVETVVELTFRDADGGTELTLVHRRLPSDTARDKHEEGWNGCFDSLGGYLAETALIH